MAKTSILRMDVPSVELLNVLASRPLPFGLQSGNPSSQFFREVYLDTDDLSLQKRGVSCWVRIDSEAKKRVLGLRVRSLTAGELALKSDVFEAKVSSTDLMQALTGDSEPARRLQALIEPSRLGPRLELETQRQSVRARRSRFSLATFEVNYDVMTVESQGNSATFQEIQYRRLRKGDPRLEVVSRFYEDSFGLRPLLEERMDRAWGLLKGLEGQALARGIQSHKQVVVLAVERGRVALRRHDSRLVLPFEDGSGEEAVRHMMRTCFGSSDGSVQLLGLAPASATLPVQEVWLARRLPRGMNIADDADLEWMPLNQLIAKVGSPEFQDPRTLAAINVAARSGVLTELPATLDTAAVGGGVPKIEQLEKPEKKKPAKEEPAISEEEAQRRYLNLELSTLAFNSRVLELAEDPNVPLLERLRFLSIFNSNMDEFFMVRVATLKRAIAAGKAREKSLDGLTVQGQLDAIAIRVRSQLDRQRKTLRESLLPALEEYDIKILDWHSISDTERDRLKAVFEEQIFPVLSPRAMTRAPGHPFPRVSNLAVSLAAMIKDPQTGPVHFAHLKLPGGVPRFIRIGDTQRYVPVEDIIKANIHLIYPRREVLEAHCFRVTRAGEVRVDEHGAGSLLYAFAQELEQRDSNEVVRIEVEKPMPEMMRNLLLRELRFERGSGVSRLTGVDVYESEELLGLRSLEELASIDLPRLHYPAFEQARPVPTDRSIFEVISERDVLVHVPYDSFDETVQRFLLEAADDPDVEALRVTLYRSGGRSEIVDALIRAAQAGKEVDVFMEIKARFDEERNIGWAKKLEEAGIHVVYGIVELKTHAKMAMVVRREGGTVKRYIHLGTGNYNADTARAYADLGLLTVDSQIAADVNDLFNELTGSSSVPSREYRKLIVAPTHMLERFLKLIERETKNAKEGRTARIVTKLNGLADRDLVDALYEASQAGVEIKLIIRGLCILRPGVEGLSENIKVLSILGRFLEHSRIYYFENDGDPEYYIGSADWRPRNLRKRVEVVTPISDPDSRKQLDEIMERQLEDETAWELGEDGTYRRVQVTADRRTRSSQEHFLAGLSDYS